MLTLQLSHGRTWRIRPDPDPVERLARSYRLWCDVQWGIALRMGRAFRKSRTIRLERIAEAYRAAVEQIWTWESKP